MKAVILAAGQGTRLRPLTNEIPKCMVKYNNNLIIDCILNRFKTANISDIAIVGGYKQSVLESHLENQNIKFFRNHNYKSSNMVSSLFSAEEFLDGDIIISYSDIIYKQSVLDKLIASKEDISVVIDQEWYHLWKLRMENPLEDAETLKINSDGNIVKIGNKANSLDEIEGQYIGLIKISKRVIKEVIDFYHSLEKDDNMYMTTFIQLIIDNLLKVSPIYIQGEWLEIDTLEDLKAYEEIELIV